MHRLFLLGISLLLQTASAFQHHKLSNSPPRHDPTIARGVLVRSAAFHDNDTLLESSAKQDQPPLLTMVLLSASLLLGLCCTPQPASAAEAETVANLPIVTELTKIGGTSGTSTASTTTAPPADSGIANYLNQVFTYENGGATKPVQMDPKLDSKEARNRAYDQAFEQDARDRDAYYGKMAMLKREKAIQDVQENRRVLELDGDGDVRPRVGDEKVAGMGSLKEYILQQDPSTLTPEELKVYRRMKGEQ